MFGRPTEYQVIWSVNFTSLKIVFVRVVCMVWKQLPPPQIKMISFLKLITIEILWNLRLRWSGWGWVGVGGKFAFKMEWVGGGMCVCVWIYPKQALCLTTVCVCIFYITAYAIPRNQSINALMAQGFVRSHQMKPKHWMQNNYYRKTSSISRTLAGNKIVDNSDVVGASPVGAAPTTSSFST